MAVPGSSRHKKYTQSVRPAHLYATPPIVSNFAPESYDGRQSTVGRPSDGRRTAIREIFRPYRATLVTANCMIAIPNRDRSVLLGTLVTRIPWYQTAERLLTKLCTGR